MKIYPALSVLLAFTVRLSAQLQPGAVAPDFTAQDLNGQSWHLYELLDAGKIVVIEFSATWCPPCWAYHNGHAWQELYEAHGPAGDNKLQVLFVEGDPATNTDCLFGMGGCNNFTPGDWVSDNTYPFIDNAAIADSFQVDYFPTVYIICPNKKVYQTGQLNAGGLWEKASGCPVAAGVNNAGIFDYSAGTGLREICGNLPVQPSFALVNLGSNPLTAAAFTLQWDNNTEQTKQWSGNLPLYGETIITFDSLLLDSPGTLKTIISSVNNNAGDDDFSNNVRNDLFTGATQFNTQQILLKIRTDNYGAETYWELRDDQENVLYKGGNPNVGPDGGGSFGNALPGPGAYADNVLINKTLSLPGDGCYSFLFVDAYGDGMCCDYGNGYYKVYNGNNPALPILTGGEFGSAEFRGFRLETTTATTAPLYDPVQLRVFPNPASDLLYIGFSIAEAERVTATVHNALGQIVHEWAPQQAAAGAQEWMLPVDRWPAGAYFVRLQAGSYVRALPFSVSR